MVGQIFFVKMVFFWKRNDRAGLELIRKDTVAERLIYHGIAKVGKSADKRCLRREVEMGSRSHNALED